jgi:hypothetical protein
MPLTMIEDREKLQEEIKEIEEGIESLNNAEMKRRQTLTELNGESGGNGDGDMEEEEGVEFF